MKKINFIKKVTPLSADTFNQMQNNIEEEFSQVNSQLADIAVNLKQYKNLSNGNDWTVALQKACDDLALTGGSIIIANIPNFITDTVNVNGNNITIVLKQDIKVKNNGINIKGKRSGVLGNGYKIIGDLKVAKLTLPAVKGQTTYTLDNNPFVVGDYVQCTSGFGRLDVHTNPLPYVIAVNGNQITVDNGALNNIPAGTYIGNFSWRNAVSLQADYSFCKDVVFDNNGGYSILVKADSRTKGIVIENCYIDNNGVDEINIQNTDNCLVKDCFFGYIYDTKKQGISFQNCTMKIERCKFYRSNSDLDLYGYGNLNGVAVEIENCEFDATAYKPHISADPASGDPSYISIGFENITNAGTTYNIAKVTVDNCKFKGYSQSVVGVIQNNVANLIIDKVFIKDSEILESRIGFFDTNVVLNQYIMENCIIDDNNIRTSSSKLFGETNGNNMIFRNCTFKNNNTEKIFRGIVDGCKFINSGNNKFAKDAKIGKLYLDNSTFYTHPTSNWENPVNIERLYIKNPAMTADPNGNITSFIKYQNNNSGRIPFTNMNGNLEGFIYCRDYEVKYAVKLYVKNGGIPTNLWGDDWKIPLYSEVEIIDATSFASKYSIVAKSYSTTLSADSSSGSNQVTLTGVTNVAVGDYINISTTGAVQTNKITAISGNTITLQNNLSANVSEGANVCVYRF